MPALAGDTVAVRSTRSGLGGDGKPSRIGTEVYGDRDLLPRDVISRKLSVPNAERIFFIRESQLDSNPSARRLPRKLAGITRIRRAGTGESRPVRKTTALKVGAIVRDRKKVPGSLGRLSETARNACDDARKSQGFSVLFFSSLVMVPSGDCVTVFSFFSTVPSLLTFSLSVWETVRSQPVVRNDNAKADVATNSAILHVFMVCSFNVADVFPLPVSTGWASAGEKLGEEAVYCYGEKPVVPLRPLLQVVFISPPHPAQPLGDSAPSC